MTDWQRETAEAIVVDFFGVRGEMRDVTVWDEVRARIVEALQAQQAKSDELIADDQAEINRLYDEKCEAERQRDEALALLRQVEWVDMEGHRCPVCGGGKHAGSTIGHTVRCELRRALAEPREAPDEC